MDKIVLLAKQPGVTSFASLYNVKRAFNTTKVGHTGTLDNFAQGLLVVCTGRLTKLAGNITEFDKTYRAVLQFGSETDTCDYEGKVVHEASLPYEETLRSVLPLFTGEQFQAPPAFSAIHVDGKRASELVRKGVQVELPARKITVYSAEVLDIQKDAAGGVVACLIEFSVSKGTYIRSLARDIGRACNSTAHLIGLYRTRVGNFDIKDAAGYSLLPAFDIETCQAIVNNFTQNGHPKAEKSLDASWQKEIVSAAQDLDEQTATLCGFKILHLKDLQAEQDFRYGRPLHKTFFADPVTIQTPDDIFAVFSPTGIFCGLVDCKNFEKQYVGYRMVMQ